MRFDEILHWTNGLFLQPQHLQYLQRSIFKYGRKNRTTYMPYPYGLIDFEIDMDALSSSRVIVKRFSAVMPDGTEISMPGNVALAPLDLTPVLKEHSEDIMVYLAVPLWSEFDANLSDGTSAVAKRLFSTAERSLRDENSGDNEISVVTRRINARLITQFDNQTDMQVLPVLKLTTVSGQGSEKEPVVDEKYIPPFMVLTQDCALSKTASDLLYKTARCRDKLLNDLTVAQFKPEAFSGINAYNMMQLRVLNLYENRLSSLLLLKNLSPFDLYLELRSYLAELRSMHPMNEIAQIGAYDHLDCAAQFNDIINDIYSMIMVEGGAGYVCLEFAPTPDGNYLYTALTTDNIVKAKEYYLAVHCSAAERQVISSLEKGDTFKLINPAAKMLRARGIKLSEMRYPPRFLPTLNDTLWFKLQVSETPSTWRDIQTEKGILIDYAADLFPNLKVSLFITVVNGN
ncbi:MAG: type VI secretion system baseplate subunit TssK [Alphaproteobacteria bacterium]|nr:type VI secretion system baseplate subunit TssK [Alphaproteobacteria bacterium]